MPAHNQISIYPCPIVELVYTEYWTGLESLENIFMNCYVMMCLTVYQWETSWSNKDCWTRLYLKDLHSNLQLFLSKLWLANDSTMLLLWFWPQRGHGSVWSLELLWLCSLVELGSGTWFYCCRCMHSICSSLGLLSAIHKSAVLLVKISHCHHLTVYYLFIISNFFSFPSYGQKNNLEHRIIPFYHNLLTNWPQIWKCVVPGLEFEVYIVKEVHLMEQSSSSTIIHNSTSPQPE